MEELRFITHEGVCGFRCSWHHDERKYDAIGWLTVYGSRIGSGTARLPTGGWIDLTQFAVVLPGPGHDEADGE